MDFNSFQNMNIDQKQHKNKKKSKIIISVIMVFCVILLMSTYMAYAYMKKDRQNEKYKNEFFKYITNNELAFFKINEVYSKINERMSNSDYNSSSNIKLSTTMENNMFSKLDLSKFEFNYNLTKNQEHNTHDSIISTKYAGNDLLTFKYISNDEQIAIKSDEIVNKYVGINKNNFQKTVNSLAQTEVDLSSIKKLKNFTVDREVIDFENIIQKTSLNEYVSIIRKNIDLGKFSKNENVALTIDSEQVPVTEYVVKLDSNQANALWNELSNKIENDEDFLSEFVVSNVIDFQNDDSNTILDYHDNDNIVEVSGEENNFNTYMNWGENTAIESNNFQNVTESQENTVDTNNTTNSTNTINSTNTSNTTNTINVSNTVENATNETNTINVYNNTTTNTVNEENAVNNNTVENQIQEQNQSQNSDAQTNTEEVIETESQEQTDEVEENDEITEEENLRMQGFITVNEESKLDQSEDNHFVIGENYEETAKNIISLSEKIDWKAYLLTGAKANCTSEELAEKLQKILNEKIKQNSSLLIKIYVSEEKTIKFVIESPEASESIDIQINKKGENEKYLNITVVKGEKDAASGYALIIYKKNSDADIKNKISINKIIKNKINQKININAETKGTRNSKKYITNLNLAYSDSDGEFKTEIENILNFDVVAEQKELNDENCLFIDKISNEELLLTKDAIKEKIIEVLSEKNRNLNIIDINNSNSIVKQLEQNQVQEDTTAKKEAKDVLVKNIANKMGEYLNAGTQLRLEDLEGLQIPGYEVDISISSNLAIITVNGYKFKLDSDFNLSDS